jgi:hypothetical protein
MFGNLSSPQFGSSMPKPKPMTGSGPIGGTNMPRKIGSSPMPMTNMPRKIGSSPMTGTPMNGKMMGGM